MTFLQKIQIILFQLCINAIIYLIECNFFARIQFYILDYIFDLPNKLHTHNLVASTAPSLQSPPKKCIKIFLKKNLAYQPHFYHHSQANINVDSKVTINDQIIIRVNNNYGDVDLHMDWEGDNNAEPTPEGVH